MNYVWQDFLINKTETHLMIELWPIETRLTFMNYVWQKLTSSLSIMSDRKSPQVYKLCRTETCLTFMNYIWQAFPINKTEACVKFINYVWQKLASSLSIMSERNLPQVYELCQRETGLTFINYVWQAFLINRTETRLTFMKYV